MNGFLESAGNLTTCSTREGDVSGEKFTGKNRNDLRSVGAVDHYAVRAWLLFLHQDCSQEGTIKGPNPLAAVMGSSEQGRTAARRHFAICGHPLDNSSLSSTNQVERQEMETRQ